VERYNYAVTFNYDADRKRNYKSRIQNGSLNLQTYYVGTSGTGAKIFEQEVSSASGTKDIHYIYGVGGQAVATHITEGGSRRTEYFHRDHLGSVALVTNDAGQAVTPASFDAFGKRRNSNWSDNATGTGLPAITGNIGFTGQESITEIGLIHMNGRIYDPNLGRFLSADPLIQAPYNSQSYNRYSYVMNNPLSLIDPSGYSWVSKKWKSVKKFAKKNWSAVKFVATAYMFGTNAAVFTNKSTRNYIKTHKWSQQVMSAGAGVADALGCLGACSAANGAYLADLNGGDIYDVAIGAISGYAMGQIAIGGTEAVAQSIANKSISAAVKYAAQTYANGKVSAAVSKYLINHTNLSGRDITFISAGLNVLGAQNDTLSFVGKVWNMPNTIVGAAFGMLGGFPTGINNNAIEWENHPLQLTAMTIGNTITYNGGNGIGTEEYWHTLQGEFLGPLYLPAHVAGGVSGLIGSWVNTATSGKITIKIK